jgi:hypothetical protein
MLSIGQVMNLLSLRITCRCVLCAGLRGCLRGCASTGVCKSSNGLHYHTLVHDTYALISRSAAKPYACPCLQKG